MDRLSECLMVYRELADHYEQIGQASMRDRFLMLAADAALQAGLREEAEHLRQRLLAGSRHHMLRPYNSFAEAASAPDVQTYLADMRTNYPLSQARDLLDSLRSGHEAPPTMKMPAPAPAAAPSTARMVPPTAPLLDLDAAARTGRIDRPVYPLQDEDPPAQPARPRAQPLPAPRPAPAPAPARQSAPAPASPAPRPQPVSPRQEPPRRSGGWFSVTLSAIVVTVALALTAFVLARPFLPTEWLR